MTITTTKGVTQVVSQNDLDTAASCGTAFLLLGISFAAISN